MIESSLDALINNSHPRYWDGYRCVLISHLADGKEISVAMWEMFIYKLYQLLPIEDKARSGMVISILFPHSRSRPAPVKTSVGLRTGRRGPIS